MGNPERRRRRVRPSSTSADPADPVPADPVPAAPVPAAPVPTPGPPPGPPPPKAVPAPPVPAPPPAPGGATAMTSEVESGASPQRRAAFGRRPTSGAGAGADERESERGLRGLVGSGSSQVSVGAALRARDASRPSDEEIAEAERDLVIVRRNWLPREELPRR